MKPGPARDGVPPSMSVWGRAATIASPTARGFFGAPGCSTGTLCQATQVLVQLSSSDWLHSQRTLPLRRPNRDIALLHW